jgi:membrane protein implicated in regulation of membrane protease activity
MQAWHWFVIGIVLAVLEVFVFGAVLLALGVAAFVVGIVVLLGGTPDWQYQVLVFIAAAIVTVTIALQIRRRYLRPKDELVNVGSRRFVGQHGLLDTPIVAGRGSVRIGDSVWPVTGADLPAGVRVKVVSSDGITLAVERAE